MKKIKKTMGMTAVIEINDRNCKNGDFRDIFAYFDHVDEVFSLFKKTSEVSKFNNGEILRKDLSVEVLKILELSGLTKKQTNGYFDVFFDDKLDVSGLVKGYAINNASKMLLRRGFNNFFVEIGGDFEIHGFKNKKKWKVGIQNPFQHDEIIKVLNVSDCGIATSGSYIRGNHIYNPLNKNVKNFVRSLTVVGPNAYDADRFATACFAMGEKGLLFLENKKNFEGYMVTHDKKAYFTKGFEKFL